METNMRAQREKVKLMQAGDADPDDIVIEKCKYQAQLDEYRSFSKAFGMKTQTERVYYDLNGRVAPSKKQYTAYLQRKEEKHRSWLHSIGADNTTLSTVAKYEAGKYTQSREYLLLKGYSHAVDKGDIHALTGFDLYRKTASDVESKIVGIETSDGVKIEAYTTHFIDRVIGQTSSSHKGMRLGVSVENVADTLTNGNACEERTLANGNFRRMYKGRKCSVVISVTDKKLIQTTPRGS